MKKPLTPPTRRVEAPFMEAALVPVAVPVEADEVPVLEPVPVEPEEELLEPLVLVPVAEGLFTSPSLRTSYLISVISLPLWS